MFPNVEEIILNGVYSINTIFAYSNIKSINLETVYLISSYSFYSCKNLKNVNLRWCNVISEFAFANSGIEGKIILGSVTLYKCAFLNTNIEEIDAQSLTYSEDSDYYSSDMDKIDVFAGCYKLKRAIIRESLDFSIFAGADNLNGIQIDKFDSLYEYPLLYDRDRTTLISCFPSGKIKEITVPQSVQRLEYGFKYCKFIEKITILSQNIYSFRKYTFKECTNLK
ncbi:cell surface protein, putative [Trichomonas vaginalis G3]|uniref:Cell surface protein, putative n=1 Tax=Trichomonas vaginalis (strain ATCC PRA-98 / G3) TaxID=412133 RepID=A2FQP5_TRIV3|nr:ribonuclease inhibitor domain-containing protein [Trichomonas vaginalis G3]EAX92754.1 cell surface protein, putative [Trichomonas vaginalis G3]KAI5498752.1 ribonuclease inhibitor domain-containing protein [Trichomonas vaginalis G3]|eukprot:XP_001305684.1 cell surface protein [Trichomonas vaginalis G3]